jgi:hypothetical protein
MKRTRNEPENEPENAHDGTCRLSIADSKKLTGAPNKKLTNEAKRLLKTKEIVFSTEFKAKRYMKINDLFL